MDCSSNKKIRATYGVLNKKAMLFRHGQHHIAIKRLSEHAARRKGFQAASMLHL